MKLSFFAKAWAHSAGHDSHASDVAWWKLWSWSPLVLASLALISIVYATGWYQRHNLRKESQVSRWSTYAFASGMATLFVALVSPLDFYSEELNSVHMVQHTLIMMVAAPLIALGSPGYLALWVIPASAWKKIGRYQRFVSQTLRASRFGHPIAVSLLYAFTLWIWHVPVLYEAALRDQRVHDLQHVAFFAASYLFWRVLFDPYGRRILNAGAGVLYLFATSMHAMILGVLMALSPAAWYSHYAKTAPHYGLSALQDQQIAGYIMWMPAGTTYVVALIILVARLVRQEKQCKP